MLGTVALSSCPDLRLVFSFYAAFYRRIATLDANGRVPHGRVVCAIPVSWLLIFVLFIVRAYPVSPVCFVTQRCILIS